MGVTSKFKLILFTTILIVAFSLSACGVTNKNAPPQPGPGSVKQQGQNLSTEYMQGTPPAPDNRVPPITQQELNNGRVRAEEIRSSLNAMREIRDPKVIVLGNTAIVGFTPMDASSNSTTIQAQLMSKVRQIDKSIANVYTTDSPDIMTKMQQISTDITNNRPAGDIGNRFNQLIQMLRPVNR